MKPKIPLLAGIAAVALCVTGCTAGQSDSINQSGGMAPPASNPSEQLEEQRLENSTKGLRFDKEGVIVQAPGSDRAKGEQLRLKAEGIYKQNAWFLAVGAFRDAILADSSNAKSYEGLARSFMIESMTDKAEPALETAIRLDPKFKEARYLLATIHQMESDYSGAVTEWKEIAAIDPSYRDIYARMAIASYYAQDYSGAWTYLGEAEKHHQDVPPQFRGLLKEVAPRP